MDLQKIVGISWTILVSTIVIIPNTINEHILIIGFITSTTQLSWDIEIMW